MKPTESPEPTNNSELLREIGVIVREQNGYGRVMVGKDRRNLTISIETHQASTSHPDERAKQPSLPDRVLIDQETVDMIAEITGSDEIKRIFVGSHPFWATVISTSLATGSSCAMWMHGIQIVSPTINPLEKVAPCCLCSTVEERMRRVNEDRKHPIPVDQVETGEPPTAPLSGASPNSQPTLDFIKRFQQRVAADSARAAAEPRRAPVESKEEPIDTNIVNAIEEIIRQGGKTRAERTTLGGKKIAYFVPRDTKLYKDLKEWGKKAIQEAVKKGQNEAAGIIRKCLDGGGYWQTFNTNLRTAKAVLAKIGIRLEELGETKKQHELGLAFGGNTDNRTGFWIDVK